MAVYSNKGRIRTRVDYDARNIINTIQTVDGVVLSAAERRYINVIVMGLKDIGVWTKIKALYGFVGGTAATHKWNWKDMRDLDAAYRLSFLGGGWVHSSSGAKPNGTSSYADTFLTANTFNSASSGLYITINRKSVTAAISAMEDLFTATSSNNTNVIGLNSTINATNGRFSYDNATLYFETSLAQPNKFTSINRLGIVRTLMGDYLTATSNGISNNLDLVNISIVLGCRNFIGGRQFFSNNEYNTFILADGLTLQEQVSARHIITTAQDIINRK